MAAGTLVPFLKKLALPGDNFEIDLNCEVMTLPTTGPLFGSYKVQLDIFEIPLRLYNANLHQNRLGVGMDMANIHLPQLRLNANNHASYVQSFDDNEHINPSCLLKYLGISGAKYREFNAAPLLGYWDIFKNYYSNKQEDNAYVIHTDVETQSNNVASIEINGGSPLPQGNSWAFVAGIAANGITEMEIWLTQPATLS